VQGERIIRGNNPSIPVQLHHIGEESWMLIGPYRRARRTIIIPRLNWHRIYYRNGGMFSTNVKRLVSSSTFVDARQSVRDNARRVSYPANIDLLRIEHCLLRAKDREIGKLSPELSSGKSVTSRYSVRFATSLFALSSKEFMPRSRV